MLSFRQFLTEKPLTPSQRRARSRQMKRLMPKIKKKRELAMKKKATMSQVKDRAERRAKSIIRKKIAGGKDPASLSYSAKVQMDKKLELKKGVIKKLTKKLIPKVKKDEAERVRKAKQKDK